jgi:predicted ATPase
MQQQQQQDDDEDDHNGSGGYGYFCRGKFDQPPSSSSSSSITTEPTTTAGIHHNEISNTNINSSSSHHSLAPFVTAITEVCRLVMQRQETVMVATAIQQELDATELQVLQESIPALRRILLATTTTTTTTTTATRPNLQRRSSTSFTTISSSHHGSRPTSAATSIITHPTTNTTYVEHWHGLKGPEAEKRYMYLFSKLIRAMSSLKDRPLIMLLDDVQWADPIALQLFQLLLTCCCRCSTTTTHSASSVHSNSHVPSAGGGGGFLLLATSRSGRDDEPSFMSALQQETLIGNSDTTVAVTNIHMEHLTLDEMNKLTADLLHLSINETLYLSTMAYQQTKGNLFFYIQYLSVLQGQGLLYIDDTTNQYTWNEHVITQSYCSTEETVLDFLTKKMLQLPDYDQIVLKTAACLGGTLYSSLLAEICFPSSQVVPALHRLQEQGLIQLDSDDVTSLGRCGAFRHDKIQEAAYSLVPPSDRTKKHLEIGLRLWIWLSPAERDLHMFTIVNQILKGLHLMDDDPVEKEDLAEFMLRAGEKATQLSSFSTAAAYFDVGIRLLSRRHWKHQYKLSLSLYNAAAEVEYYNGNLARVDALLTKLFKHAKSLDDTFRAHFTQIYSLGSRDDMKQALDKGLEVLKQLGENFPARPRKVQGELAWYRCQCLLRGKSDDDILNLPLMRDNRKLVAMRLLNTIWGFTIARDELGPFLLKRMVKNTLRHGLSPMCKCCMPISMGSSVRKVILTVAVIVFPLLQAALVLPALDIT